MYVYDKANELARSLKESKEYLEYKKAKEEVKEVPELKEHYGKTIGEVATFLEDQNNQLLYAKAQSNELSEQYRVLVAYEKADRKKAIANHGRSR